MVFIPLSCLSWVRHGLEKEGALESDHPRRLWVSRLIFIGGMFLNWHPNLHNISNEYMCGLQGWENLTDEPVC